MADKRSILYQGATANTPSVQTSATVLASNTARGAFMIQNQSTNALYILLGSGCTTSVYHVILKACTGTADGSGGTVAMESGTVYTGIITCAGTNPSYTVLEI